MKISKRTVWILSAALLFWVVACASAGTPQKRVIIRIEVKPPDTALIKSLVEEGESLRIEDHTNDKIYAFKPDVNSSPPKIQVFQIQKDASSGKETEVLLEEASIASIGPSSSPTKVLNGSYVVRILQVIKP
jgi:hypothetical protein